MLRKLALLLISFIPAIAAQAFSASISITNVTSHYGTCAAGDFINIDMNASFAGTVDDGGDFDRFTLIFYDGYGTPLTVFNGSFTVGPSFSVATISLMPLTDAQARPFTLTIYDTPAAVSAADAASFPIVVSVTFDPAEYGVCDFLPLPASANGDSVPQFRDGRINNFDMAAPFVVYGHDFEDGRGLVIYSPEGDLLLTVSPDAFALECTGETIELASDNGVTLYLLASCEYQLMASSLDGTKNYILIFNEPYPDTGYTSYEE